MEDITVDCVLQINQIKKQEASLDELQKKLEIYGENINQYWVSSEMKYINMEIENIIDKVKQSRNELEDLRTNIELLNENTDKELL